MKISLALPLAVAGQLLCGPAFAQGPDHNVLIQRISGPQLGVRLVEVDQDAVTRLKLKEEKGALVTEVLKDSAAEKAGIRVDDVILKLQGESILTAAQLSRLVKDVPSGRKVDLDVVRAGAPLKLTATLENKAWSRGEGEMPFAGGRKEMNELMGKMGDLRWFSGKLDGKDDDGKPRELTFSIDEPGPHAMAMFRPGRGRLGVSYSEIEGQLAKYFKAPKESAVLVNSVVEDSPAAKAGIKAGDLLTKVGSASIEDGSDLMEAIGDLEGGTASPVTVWRDGKSLDLSVTLDKETEEPTRLLRRRRPVS